MKVLVISPFAVWPTHLETDLEIIQDHLDSGDSVHLLACSASLLSCDPNKDHEPGICLRCIGRSKAGLRLVDQSVKVSPLIKLEEEDKTALRCLQTEFNNVAELRSYVVDDFDIGMGVLSSLVSVLRNPSPNLDDPAIKEQIENHILSSFAVYRSVRRYIRIESIDLAYVFNGRLASLRAAFRAARAESVQCYTHDRGCDFNHYELYENSLPHNIDIMEGRIKASWDSGSPSTREHVGAQFFQERIKGVQQNWFSFTGDQTGGSLPTGWDAQMYNIVVFTSSEDEFVAIGDEWVNPLYANQLECLKRIANDLNGERLKVYVRMHPNLKEIKASHIEETLSLQSTLIEVIPPDSDVDSYELLKRADKVLSFGSTIGIEATYWGTVSVLAGISFYRNLGATYNPSNHQELLELLLRKDLLPQPKEKALMYGYFQKTKGKKYIHYEGLDVWDGLFKGERIVPSPFYRRLSTRLRWFEPILKPLSQLRIRKTLGV